MKTVLGLLAVAILLTLSATAEALDCTPGTVDSLQPGCQGGATININKANANADASAAATVTNAFGNGGNSPGIAIAPAVFAPGLAVGGTVCLGSKSGGVSVGVVGVGAGLTLGTTVEDEKCNDREDAKTMSSLGDPEAGKARMCRRPENAESYAAVGRPCPKPVSVSKPIASASLPTMSVMADSGGVTVSSMPNRDETKVSCAGGIPPIRAANGEWFCR